MFISVRKYRNVKSVAEVKRRVEEEFLPVLRRNPGFLAYHLIGGLHSTETGPSEMLIELAYRLATETSPLIKQIRDNVYVSITPVADPDGRDRNVDWFYKTREEQASRPAAAGGGGGGRGGAGIPYWPG